MKETFGAFLLIVYGAIIGLMLAPILGVDTSAWTAIATGIRDFTTALGICIGGIWAYGKYLRNREGEVRVQLSHSVTSVELDQRLLLRIVLEIKNVGPVAALPSAAHTLLQLPPELAVDGSEDPSSVWVTLHRLEFDFTKDHLCIEPGDMVHYSRDVTLDANTRYVQLYTRAELGVDSWHTDETSVHKLNPTAAVAGSEIKQQIVPSDNQRGQCPPESAPAMTRDTIIEVKVSDTASVQVSATAKPEVYQFGGLLWALEYNAYQARLGTGVDSQTVNAMNSLLTAYAALEALVSETASAVLPPLYADKKFRRHGLVQKFRRLLDETGRAGEPVPEIVEEISDNRIALTHSEPDNERSAKLGNVISASDALRFARAVRKIADWLWQGKRPGAVAAAHDQVNGFLGAESEAKFKAL